MQKNQVNLKYLKVFFFVLIVVIVGAVVYRLYLELTQSYFKNNSFSLLVVSKDSKLIFVDKKARSALFLSLGDVSKYVKGKNTFEATLSLGIPINGMLIDDNSPSRVREFITAHNEFRLLSISDRFLKNVNRYDIHKVISALKSADRDNLFEARVDLFNNKDLKDKLEAKFTDSSVRNLQYTIEIQNGTTINGLGSILALVLSRQGFNVVAVRTAKPMQYSFISSIMEGNQYVDTLKSLTGFTLIKKQFSKAADVTIFLGDDIDSMLSP